jgi:hypothetical protein
MRPSSNGLKTTNVSEAALRSTGVYFPTVFIAEAKVNEHNQMSLCQNKDYKEYQLPRSVSTPLETYKQEYGFPGSTPVPAPDVWRRLSHGGWCNTSSLCLPGNFTTRTVIEHPFESSKILKIIKRLSEALPATRSMSVAAISFSEHRNKSNIFSWRLY